MLLGKITEYSENLCKEDILNIGLDEMMIKISFGYHLRQNAEFKLQMYY